ncbi:MAG TPA: LysM peptidoglycan-binding domain-containing protein [Bacillota bacterium]
MRRGRVRPMTCLFRILIFLCLFFLLASLPVRGEDGSWVYGSDLRSTLRNLAERSGIRLLMDSTVQGPVSTEFREDLPARVVVGLLADTYGYSCQWSTDGKTMMIGQAENLLNPGAEETVEYQLYHINPGELISELRTILPPEKIRMEQDTKKLVITGNPLEQANALGLINRYDRDKNVLLVEIRLEEISTEVLKKLGWFDYDRLVPGSPLKFNIVERQRVDDLEAQNRASLIVESRLTATEGEKAHTFVGDRYPVIFTRITEKGVEEVIDYKEVGINLTLLPREEKETIIVDLAVEVNSISDWQKTVRGGDIPVITQTKASATRKLQAGEAFVLTGFDLIQRGDEKRIPPALSELPVIGGIIRARDLVTVKNNFGEERLPCLIITPKRAQIDSPGSKERPADSPGNSPAVVTTEVYNITSEKAGTGESVPQIVTQVELVGEEEHPTGKKEAIPAIEVVVTEKTDTPDEKKASPVEGGVGLRISYSVQKGDTVYGIARKFGLDPNRILQVNNLTSSSMLSVEDVLILPVPEDHLYQVKPGETVWRIAKRYGLDPELLMEINSLSDVTAIKTGQVLILPVPVDRVSNPEY